MIGDLNSWDGWGAAGQTLAWVVTSLLLLAGIAGCIIPALPGHLFILIAAIAHHLMLGSKSGVDWWTYAVLGTCLVVSQVLEFMSGAAGSRWFGGTRWGSAGALGGGLVGLFFFPLGLLLGPLIGCFACEWMFARRKLHESAKSGVGSVFGTVTGLAIKIVIGLVMVLWFLVDVLWIAPA
jgi:uncharacterized protein YqgC (DUF456 family)